MAGQKALEPGVFYHIYHRGNNRVPIFFEEKNYRYFLRLYIKYIEPVAFTYAYSLLNNHCHFAIRTKTEAEQKAYQQQTSEVLETSEVLKTSEVYFKFLQPSQQFSNLFNSYAKSINKAYGRTGSLFENKFGRKPILSERHFYNLIIYIHRNPQHHGLVDDFRHWPWSSYDAILLEKETRVQRTAVLAWFEGKAGFQDSHAVAADESEIAHLLADDFV